MPSKVIFADVTALFGSQARQSQSAAIASERQTPGAAERPTVSDTVLSLGLLIAIAVGLIALRAALWLPPLDV